VSHEQAAFQRCARKALRLLANLTWCALNARDVPASQEEAGATWASLKAARGSTKAWRCALSDPGRNHSSGMSKSVQT
jgi:hypothetical protein